MAFRELALDLLEGAPQARQRVVRNAYSGVRNGNADPSPRAARADRNAAPLRREFHRVGQQVEHNLLEQPLIGAQANAGPYARRQSQSLVIGTRRDDAHCVMQESFQLDGLCIESNATSLDLRHVENVIDDFEEVLPALPDVAAIFAIFLGSERT